VTGNLEELDELIAKEKEAGLFVSVGFQLCFSGGTLALKKDILDGLFGRPLEFKALKLPRRGTKYYQRNGWAGKLSFEGSSILDSPLQNACSHDMQVMLFLLGDQMRTSVPVESVTAETWQGRPDIENYDAAALRLEAADGLKIHFYTAHCVEENMSKSTGEFRFEKAVVKWTESAESVFTACSNDGRVKSYEGFENKKQYQKIYDTIDAIRSGTPPVCTLETVRPHLQCVTMVQRQPIIKVPPEKISMVNLADDVYYYVPGLQEAFLSAYEKNALPSEIGFIG
jgi:predicted dehydrogenase